MYMSACFSPNGVQVLTCGTDRKIAYWETLDGSLVRDIEGSGVGALNCLNISPDGLHFVTGSNDCIVKLWDYHMGETSHIGVGHAAIITACKFSPDSKHIVTVSADGAIMIWKSPFDPVFQKPQESYRSRSTCSIREEEWKKLNIDQLKNGEENVMEISSRTNDSESVKTVHSGITLLFYFVFFPEKGDMNIFLRSFLKICYIFLQRPKMPDLAYVILRNLLKKFADVKKGTKECRSVSEEKLLNHQ